MPPHIDPTRWFIDEVQPHEPALRAYLRGRFPSLHDVDDPVREAHARHRQTFFFNDTLVH